MLNSPNSQKGSLEPIHLEIVLLGLCFSSIFGRRAEIVLESLCNQLQAVPLIELKAHSFKLCKNLIKRNYTYRNSFSICLRKIHCNTKRSLLSDFVSRKRFLWWTKTFFSNSLWVPTIIWEKLFESSSLLFTSSPDSYYHRKYVNSFQALHYSKIYYTHRYVTCVRHKSLAYMSKQTIVIFTLNFEGRVVLR